MKIAVIGAGSISFGIGLIKDICLSDKICSGDLTISLMDIDGKNLDDIYQFSLKVIEKCNRNISLSYTLDLKEAIKSADYVVTAIEVDRYDYWHMDFHIPKLYGSTQAYGENGGPGSMFHFLRNVGPMLDIAKAMEELCPEAWLINYTNPEVKLIEAITKLTNIKCVGLCHGLAMGLGQVADFLEIDVKDIDYIGGGLNHFGWFLELRDKKTGEDLYPKLFSADKKIDPLYQFDHVSLSRMMLNLYGLYSYPGNNHIGEYVRFGKEFYAAYPAQYYYDPVLNTKSRFIYAAEFDTLNPSKYPSKEEWNPYQLEDNICCSGEYAVPIIEGLYFDVETIIPAVNMSNGQTFKGLDADMVVESQAIVNKNGIKFIHKGLELPTAINSYTRIQGDIHKLLIEAYRELSREKVLQAILLDPQCPEYYQAVKMVDEFMEKQATLLPKLVWQRKK